MQKEDCYFLGTITKKHGYKGELNLHLDTDEPEVYNNLESIFVENSGLLVPFFLKKAKLHKGNHLRIVLEDFETPEALIGRSVYLPLSTLPKLGENKFYFHEVIGYNIIDLDEREIGEIVFVRDTSSQDLFEIKNLEGKEILIPVIDEWIIKVNHSNKTIQMKLPEGLLDVF